MKIGYFHTFPKQKYRKDEFSLILTGCLENEDAENEDLRPKTQKAKTPTKSWKTKTQKPKTLEKSWKIKTQKAKTPCQKLENEDPES